MPPNKKLKICIISTSFPLNESSTSGIFVKHLADALNQIADISVLTPASITDSAPHSDHYPIKSFRYAPRKWQKLCHQPGGIPVALKNDKTNYLILPFFLSSLFWHAFRACRKSDAIQANWSINGLIAGLAGKITTTPVITTLRGEDKHRAKQSTVDNFILKGCISLSDKIITVSSDMHKQLINDYPAQKNKIYFVPNGVSDELLSIPKKKTHNSSGPLKLITIGSLIPRKGISQLLTAISIINKESRPTLKIAGDGPLKIELMEACNQLGIKENIEFMGAVSYYKIPPLLESSDAFVHCSYSEGRPNVVIEAMAANLPIVATAIDGVVELINNGENGLLYKPDDIETLVMHLSSLTVNTEKRQLLADNARTKIINDQLCWKETASNYLKLIQQSVL